jgi:hypothetical protein
VGVTKPGLAVVVFSCLLGHLQEFLWEWEGLGAPSDWTWAGK